MFDITPCSRPPRPCLLVLGLLVAMSLIPVYADAPDPAPAADADGPPDLQTVIDAVDIRPYTIHMSMSVQLDDDQKPHHRERDMTMQVLLEYDRDLALRQCEGIDIDHAVTSAGEPLKVRQLEHLHRGHGFFPRGGHARHHWFDEHFADEDPRLVMTLAVPFEYPARAADRIDTLTGAVRLRVASGAVRHAVLGPFEAVRGRRVRIPNLDDGEVRIVHNVDHGQLEIRMPSRLGDLLKEVTFYSADNRELPGHPFGRHVEGDRAVFYYDAHLPDDARIALAFYSRVDDFRVPFHWQDVPLPTPPADDRGFARHR